MYPTGDLSELADRTLRNSQMDSIGLYTFDGQGEFESGLILGMPPAFTHAYERTGIPIDPVLKRVRSDGAPCSTKTCLGERWTASELYQRVSGRFGLHGFAALPLYRGERLAGVLYLGASRPESAARLDPEGLCSLTIHATRVSSALAMLPRRHPRLTLRQHEVARLAAEGLSNREIAEALRTGEAAVRKHLKCLNVIFATTNRTAMSAAWREGTAAT